MHSIMAGAVRQTDVLGRDEAATMAHLVEQRRIADRAAASELAAVAHWAELHRVDTRVEVGAVDPDLWHVLEDQRSAEAAAGVAGPGHVPGSDEVAHGLLGREGELRLAGEGAFTVTEFAVAELAAGLGLSETAARAYVGQAVELRDRLPRCWHKVMSGHLAAWKARRIAQETIPLSGAAATYVDTHLAPFAAGLSVTRILRAVTAATVRHEPALAAERARAAAEHRGVWLHDALDGTTRIEAVTGTPDAIAFDTALADMAATLAALGDDDTIQVRRARAVGILADPQYALDMAATADTAVQVDEPATRPSRTSSGRPGRPGGAGRQGGPTIHVHLHTALATCATGDEGATAGCGVSAEVEDGTAPVEPVARVHGAGVIPGPRSTEAVTQWLNDLCPGAVVTVTPVVDLTERISVSAYEVPDRLRAQVEQRDDGCRFPWCGRVGAFDVDHIDPYRVADDHPGGPPPPGQTSTDNLARLCRFHHRLKTHGDWRYERALNGVLTWTSPLERIYAVDENGTYPR